MKKSSIKRQDNNFNKESTGDFGHVDLYVDHVLLIIFVIIATNIIGKTYFKLIKFNF